MRNRILLCLLIGLIAGSPVSGQESIVPLRYNTQLEGVPSPSPVVAKAPLQLPFIDDFSAGGPYPNPLKWTDNEVFINNGFPIAPPSIGVATFDGLRANGRPYSFAANAYGSSDTLTSQPIDLSPYTAADSVYLSFFYQPKGLGNEPENRDTLLLEFKVNDTTWATQWRQVPANQATDTFAQVFVGVVDAQWFTNDFQFRFRNYSAQTGNIDHWHVDYVVLDEGRSRINPILNDVAFVRNGRSLLKNYQAMPLYQLIGHEQEELADSLFASSINHFNTIKNTTFRYAATESCGGSTLASDFFQTINYPPSSDTLLKEENYTTSLTSLLSTIACDSLVVTTRYWLNNSPPDFTTSFNDTVVHQQRFYNYLAYDDGTAEVAYRLQGNAAQMALQFSLNEPDSLQAVQVHFAHVDKDISGLLINLVVWKSLDRPSGLSDSVIYRKDLIFPAYIDSLNGWATYQLDSAIWLSDTFYIGFQQVGEDNIRIGFDQNNDAKEHLSFYVAGQWNASSLPGALLLRPLLGEPVDIIGVGRQKAPVKSPGILSLYPNPTRQYLYVDRIVEGVGQMQIRNVMGQVVWRGTSQRKISVQNLPGGLYWLEYSHPGKAVKVGKFLKLH